MSYLTMQCHDHLTKQKQFWYFLFIFFIQIKINKNRWHAKNTKIQKYRKTTIFATWPLWCNNECKIHTNVCLVLSCASSLLLYTYSLMTYQYCILWDSVASIMNVRQVNEIRLEVNKEMNYEWKLSGFHWLINHQRNISTNHDLLVLHFFMTYLPGTVTACKVTINVLSDKPVLKNLFADSKMSNFFYKWIISSISNGYYIKLRKVIHPNDICLKANLAIIKKYNYFLKKPVSTNVLHKHFEIWLEVHVWRNLTWKLNYFIKHANIHLKMYLCVL